MSNKQSSYDQTMLNVQDSNRMNSNSSILSRVFNKLGDIIVASTANKGLNNRGIQVEHNKGTGTRSTLSQTQQIDFLSFLEEEDDDDGSGPISSEHLIQLIEMSLLEAKSQELGKVEVLVPSNLIVRVAEDIMQLSKNEPCGLRGGTVFLEYADRAVGILPLGRFRMDHAAPATFDVVLTFRPEQASWLRPALSVKGYLRKRGNGLVVVSSSYALAKNRLYRNEENVETVT